MKSIYFKNSNDVGFEVATANDIIKAQELGLYICNKDEDYFNSYVTELDEDGNVFYTDATWADTDKARNTNEQEFIKFNDEAGYQSAIFGQAFEGEDLYFWAHSNVAIQYFWRDSIWTSHLPDVSFSEIQSFYQKALDKSV